MSDTSGGSVLEIHDPEVDAQAVLQRVAEGVAQRREAGAYGPDPALLGPDSLRLPSSPGSESTETYLDFQAIHQALAEMTSQARLQELTFTSQVPVIGRLLIALRKAWSWMAARWIERHMIEQQSVFNAAAVQFSGELVHWQDANLWRLRQLEEQVHAQELRLSGLEGEAEAAPSGREVTP